MCNECERSSMVHLTSLCCHLNQMPFFYSRTHSMIKHVTSSSDWWMLFGHSNNPRGSTLNNDKRTWLMSTVSSCWGESFRLSLLHRAPCDERSSFAGATMIDISRSQLFKRSLHTSWSLTSGVSKMNGPPLSRNGGVIFSYSPVQAPCREKVKP